MCAKIVSSLLPVMMEENALASHGHVSDCRSTRDVRSSVDFNRALQSVVGSVAIGIGATSPGDCVQFDSTITHRLTIFSSEVCVRTHGHCLEGDLGLTQDRSPPVGSEQGRI